MKWQFSNKIEQFSCYPANIHTEQYSCFLLLPETTIHLYDEKPEIVLLRYMFQYNLVYSSEAAALLINSPANCIRDHLI